MMSLKNFWFKDYEWEQHPYNNKKGYRLVYRYNGKWKKWDISNYGLLRHRIIIFVVSLFCAVSFFYANMVSCNTNQIKAEQLCTLLAFAALVFLIIGVILFVFSGKKMTNSAAVLQKQLILWSSGIGAAVLSLSSVFTIISRDITLIKEYAGVLICNAIFVILQMVIFFLQKRIEITDI